MGSPANLLCKIIVLMLTILLVSCGEDEKPTAKVAPNPPELELDRQFSSSASAHHVPKEVLLSVAKYESSFETNRNTGLQNQVQVKGYGLFNLTEDVNSQIVNLERSKQIDLYAKLLAETAAKNAPPQNILDWLKIASIVHQGKEEVSDVYKALYVNELKSILILGFNIMTSDGQRLVLNPQNQLVGDNKIVGSELEYIGLSGMCDVNLPCQKLPLDSNNYMPDVEKRKRQEVTKVILHACESSFSDCIRWFSKRGSKMSGHFIVSSTGSLVQMVDVGFIARDVPDVAISKNTVSIFLAGKSGGYDKESVLWEDPMWLTKSAYQTTAKLIKSLSLNYKDITIDTSHIVSYQSIYPNDWSVRGLGQYMDWDYLMTLINSNGVLSSTLVIDEPAYLSTHPNNFSIKLRFPQDVHHIQLFFDHAKSGWGAFPSAILETGGTTELIQPWTLKYDGAFKNKSRSVLVKAFNANDQLIAREQSSFFIQ